MSKLPVYPTPESAPEAENLLQVGELARRAGKTVRAVHLYEELELLKPAARSKGRFRLYGPEAVTRVRWIAKLQEMGFTLGDIQAVVKDVGDSGMAHAAMAKLGELYTQKLAETRDTLQRMRELEHELVHALEYLADCGDMCEPSRLITACKSCNLHTENACHQSPPDLVRGMHLGDS